MKATILKFVGFNKQVGLLEFQTPKGELIYSNNIETLMMERPSNNNWINYVPSHSTVSFTVDNGKENQQVDNDDLIKLSSI